MNLFGRIAASATSLVLLGGLGLTVGAAPAAATISTLCTGYTACNKAGMSDSGYSQWRSTMYWRMYSGHNCTNYAAYRMVQTGMPNTRPWSGSGNASNWGTAMSRITDSTPAVGAVAWWKAGVRPAGSSGHVAYVEKVVSANEIIVSQDSWNGDFSWARITRSGTGWPSGFIHFNDVRVRNTAAPTVQGTARVGSALTASPGLWNPSSATVAYQWLQDGTAIAGATAATLSLAQAQQGKRITVRVTASSPGVSGASAVSAATAAVAPGAISSTEAPTITGDPRVGATLSAGPGTWTPAANSLRYQWRAAGAPIAGATTPSLVVEPALAGKPITVTVTAVRTGYAAVAVTSAPTAPVAEGTLELADLPGVAGATTPGQTLELVLPEVAPQTDVAVQWFRAGRAVPGATGTTYPVTTADLGSRLLAQVRLSRPGFAPLTRRTFSTALVRATPVLRVATVPGVRTLAVTASVRAAGVPAVAGTLQVRSRGQLVRAVRVEDGIARTRVSALPRGARTYRFWFLATPTVARGVVAQRITIR